jgi:phosphoglycolate phosphatase-like HAD superfamily hydrolase
MIKTIYLDMDGVLCDFEERYSKLFNETPSATRDKKNFSPNWRKFVKGENFSTLKWYPGGRELLSFIRNYPVEVQILSSSGGEKFHDEVTAQKVKWLQDNEIDYEPNIVPGRGLKKDYARPDVILIDDTESNIDDFNAAGGYGILHKDVEKTKEMLKKLLESSLNK